VKILVALTIAILIIIPAGLASSYTSISLSDKVSAYSLLKNQMMLSGANAMRTPARPSYVGMSRLGSRYVPMASTIQQVAEIRNAGEIKTASSVQRLRNLNINSASTGSRLTRTNYKTSKFRFLGLGGLIK